MSEIVWAKVEEKVELTDTGDILTPLRRVQQAYRARAEKHVLAGHPERAAYCHEQAENMGGLIQHGTCQVFDERVSGL